MIILRTLKHISSLNIVASILLFLTAILAALIANSSLSPIYIRTSCFRNFICVSVISIYFRMAGIR